MYTIIYMQEHVMHTPNHSNFNSPSGCSVRRHQKYQVINSKIKNLGQFYINTGPDTIK